MTKKQIEDTIHLLDLETMCCWETVKDAISGLYELLGYKDLEEELDCPLEVVFKALKQDYIYTKGGRCSGLELGTFGDKWCICCGLRLQIRVDGYKKTWWLKEDKSE